MSINANLKISTGIKKLDELLGNVRWGDNIVWHVPSIKEYAIFVRYFLQYCSDNDFKVVYIKINGGLEKIMKKHFIEVYDASDLSHQEQLIEKIKCFMEEKSCYTQYVFDNILFQNSFPFLHFSKHRLKSVTYLPLWKNSINNEDMVKIIDSCQVLIDVNRTGEAISISLIKVCGRFTPNMFKPHLLDPDTKEMKQLFNHVLSTGNLVEKTREVLKIKHDLEEFKERYQDLIEITFRPSKIIGKSEKIRKVCELIGKIAKSETTVLIQGESGTGKEVIAQNIYLHSLRNKQPFIKVNCAALTETLLESELFGHKKGAFTGAISNSKGKFRQACGGTILLDEIGCMSLSGQAKLLRVLQEKEIIPVGESIPIKVDVRVIATTNVDLAQAVKEGKFREDLYYRLRVIPIYLPPLKERMEDVPLLAEYFLKKYVNETKKI